MKISAMVISVCLAAGLLATGSGAWAETLTFQHLMDPTVFPDAQFGMKVESVSEKPDSVSITTTGAVVTIDAATGTISLNQRIGQERPVATLDLGQPLRGLNVTHNGEGFARVTIDQPKATVRVNGDSLCTVHVAEALSAKVNAQIQPAWNTSWKTNHLVVDELGGFAIYCSDLNLIDQYDAYATPVATYPLPTDTVLALGVCPPKPYDWDRSLNEHVAWHWSPHTSYPPDDVLRSWKKLGNMVLLQSEVMLWKDWNLDFVPRLGMEEWDRVRNTLHEENLPFIVYTSPYYFLKGTSQEKQAVNDKPGACPGGVTTGENMDLFLEAITRVMRDLKPDGLFFDGQYGENPAATYALARLSRQIVGDDAIIEWHSTSEIGKWGSWMYMPQADAYTDIQLRGELHAALYSDYDYMRFLVSGYNIHNCIGVLCNNSGKRLPKNELELLLQSNARLSTLIEVPERHKMVLKKYRPRLTPEYKAEVDRLVTERQSKVAEKAAAVRQFLEGSKEPSAIAKAFEFDAMPIGRKNVSGANPDPFSMADGNLNITALANTHAFLKMKMNKNISGFEIKLRQGTDQGTTWGPAVVVKWASGDLVRIGTGGNTLRFNAPWREKIGPAYDPQTWVWLRARWLKTMGIVEYSTDGIHYERFHTFYYEAGDSKATEVLVGKVPITFKPQDNKEPGKIGTCEIDYVRFYGR